MGEPAQLEWHDTDTYNSADRQPSNDLDLGCLRQQGRQCGSFPGRAESQLVGNAPCTPLGDSRCGEISTPQHSLGAHAKRIPTYNGDAGKDRLARSAVAEHCAPPRRARTPSPTYKRCLVSSFFGSLAARAELAEAR